MNDQVNQIIQESIKVVLPDVSLKKHLVGKSFSGDVYVVAIGKAAYTMAKAASEVIPNIKRGIVITKYKHLKGTIKNFELYEAGHPILDENTILATSKVLDLTSNLKDDDSLIFLVSGGGSSLFEKAVVNLNTLQDINEQLLRSGANINEINSIRKRLSLVKGGRFAKHVSPAKIYQYVLSDVVGDKLDIIASGPAIVDSTTYEDTLSIIDKYHIDIDKDILQKDTIKKIENTETTIIGNLNIMCDKASEIANSLGYNTKVLTYSLSGEARLKAKEFATLCLKEKPNTCLIMGGETTVTVKGSGLGGRNSEFVLTCAKYINNRNITIFSIGSDGTDGPTDAAGGIVDGDTINKLEKLNIDLDMVLENNDSYHALEKIDGLIKTGPTGTNVNDLIVALIK